MHSKEFIELAQCMDEISEVVLGFASMSGSVNSIIILGYNEDMETYSVTHAVRMQHRDLTFMQWSWENRWAFQTGRDATHRFRSLI